MKRMGSSRQRCGETFEPRRLEGAIYPADTYSIIKTYRTDLDGAVSFYLDGKSVNPRLASLR